MCCRFKKRRKRANEEAPKRLRSVGIEKNENEKIDTVEKEEDSKKKGSPCTSKKNKKGTGEVLICIWLAAEWARGSRSAGTLTD